MSWGGHDDEGAKLQLVSEDWRVDENGSVPAGAVTAEPAPASGAQPEAGDEEFNVYLRLSDGERAEAGSFEGEQAAHAFADELMSASAGATATSRWPRIGDRYLRPETIISIDVERSNQPGWTGSTGRASSWKSS